MLEYLRLKDRFDYSPCSSDRMRVDAWRVALQGTKENYLLPASDIYSVYYKKTDIGQFTQATCNYTFVTVHNFYLEQLYYGGIFWFLLLFLILGKIVRDTWRTVLGLGFVAFLVFLAVSPTYPQFYALLLYYIAMLYSERVDYY